MPKLIQHPVTGDWMDDRRKVESSPTYKMLYGVFLSILIAGGGTWMTVIYSTIVDLNKKVAFHGERIATLEARMVSVDQHLQNIDTNVERIAQRIYEQWKATHR